MALEIKYRDKEALVSILAKLSEVSAASGATFFRNLVKQANFSEPIKAKGGAGYTGDPKFDARRLVDFALTIGTNPNDKNAALGSIMYPLIPELGVEDATFMAGMIVTYRLVQSNAMLGELTARYQIPERPVAALAGAAPIFRGPEVHWTNETERLELQGWFAADPEWLDVGLLIKAASRARSVCRVEVNTNNTRGTGLLVARDFVLTNYHVLGGSLEAPLEVLQQNAASTVVRFGAFTADEVNPAAGQELRLASQNPVVASSVKYDFALLRLSDSIDRTVNVSPFAVLGPVPQKGGTLYILQHPEGASMKVALNTNGVTWVDPDLVHLQYTTKVTGGSSGSPCFDANWNLAALHHAGANTKGEGILMSSIFGMIQEYIKT